ncbi:hypothetical protein DSECCO2_364240 [anaerobic digester metagenome]
MNLSEKFNLSFKGHAHYNFVDIHLGVDNRLYVEPLLVQYFDDEYSKEASLSLNDYLKQVMQCFSNKNDMDLHRLFAPATELKSVYLGMSKMTNKGRGAGDKILYKVFSSVYETIDQSSLDDVEMYTYTALPLIAKNFDKDRMSDLICRLCLKAIHAFTLDQAAKFNIPISQNEIELGYCWDNESHSWKMFRGKVPTYNGKPVLLTPKKWVVTSPISNPNSFLLVECAYIKQKEHFANKTALSQKYTKDGELYYDMPSKKQVYESDFKGNCAKDVIGDFVSEGTVDFQAFINRKRLVIAKRGQYLSDEKLDLLLYSCGGQAELA